MNKKRVVRIFGSLVLFFGTFVLLNGFSGITGFMIIDGLEGGPGYFFGAILFISGIFISFILNTNQQQSLESIVSTQMFAKRISDIEPDEKKRSLILDTSVLLRYSIDELKNLLQPYSRVYVPESVLKEIKDPQKRKYIEQSTSRIEVEDKYKNIARKYLEKTEKPKTRAFLLPYLRGEKLIIDAKEQTEVARKVERITKLMKKDGVELETAKKTPRYTLQKVGDYLNDHCKVSETDIEVLAYALREARHNRHAILGERDRDYEEAIELIKGRSKRELGPRVNIGNHIDFVNNYNN